MQKVAQIPRLEFLKTKLETKQKKIPLSTQEESLLGIVNTRYEKVSKC
ncbi:hypothetical protein KKG31_07810 [Patescibacteria group bacterium]|nr:hypothetical protein [Patescibacteria group bacterium]MBU1758971.1 hypothetical protein [Patescibacteria group bacterium]